MIFYELVINVALLLTLSMLYTLISRRWKREKVIGQALHGLLFGGVVLGVMISPMHLTPGVVFDTRSVVVSIAGLFGGPVTATITVIFASAYRIYEGGVGTFTGILVVFVSAGLGIGYYYLKQSYSGAMRPLYLFIFGVIVHLVMLLCMFTLPWPLAFQVLRKISLPVILIYPLGTFLLAILLADRELYIETEEALRASEKRYRMLIESSSDAILVLDVERNVVSCNSAFLHLFGYDRPEVLGKSIRLIHPSEESYRSFGKAAYPEIERVGSFRTEWEFLRKDETICPAETITSAIKSPDGSTTGYVAIIRDITERKKMEEDLRESERKYSALVQESPDAIVSLDRTGKLLSFNPAAERLSGFSAEEVIGKHFAKISILAKQSIPKALKEFALVIAGTERPPFELTIAHKDKNYLFMEANPRLIKRKGEKPWIQVTFRDITDRKRAEGVKKKLEAQLQQAQKMEAIGTLASGIAHDFNNLLMSIQGRTSLMAMKTDASHPHFQHLKGIEADIRSASGLTRQLLGVARSGKYEVKPTNLNHIIHTSSEIFGRAKKEITIHRKVQKDIWTVEVDQTQIEQVLLNLYVNAWQAMSGTGELSLETENVTLLKAFVRPYGVKPGNYVKISVTDSGVGMDEETQKRAFDPFFTTKEKTRGTGLGLASAYGIIRNHGGIIHVYSEIGKGATFNIYLPASEKKVKKEKAISGKLLKGTETLLLIDDEEMIIEVGQELLENLGYTVWPAKSGKEAIAIYQRERDRIDGVILDMIMPEMGGSETYDELKTINPEVKVLLSSGYSINGLAKTILAKGCNGFIQKPFSLADLSHKLREILDQK